VTLTVINKSALTESDNPMSRGIIAGSLDEVDELTAPDHHAITTFPGSTKGRLIRSRADQVRAMGRRSRWSPWFWRRGDSLVGSEVGEKMDCLLSIAETATASARRFDYRLTHQRGKGVINRRHHQTVKVVGVLPCMKIRS